MKQKHGLLTLLLITTLVGVIIGLTLTRLILPAKAAPITPAATGALADLFGGKTYPLVLKAEQIDSSYHLVEFVDAQGKASSYATRGETVAAGSETFLVCYDVPTTSSATKPPQPKSGEYAALIYLNLHAVQAMGGILPIVPAPTPAATPPAP